jgi:hypothetical protein
MGRLKIGDIIEISTQKGLAYAQFTHKHRVFGELIRIIPGFWQRRPESFGAIADQAHVFVCFFPVSAAVNRGIMEVVGNATVPKEAQRFPVFRDGIADPVTGKVAVWWLWDGENEWKVGNLTSEQRKFPVSGVWNDTLLVERIESGWTPEKDSE